MIDHISIAVRDLKAAEAFYTALLAPLGLSKLREWPDAAIGYGKKYPEFWINRRADMAASVTIAACMSACGRTRQRPSMRFMRRRSRTAVLPMARQVCAPNTMIATTRHSSAMRMATASKR